LYFQPVIYLKIQSKLGEAVQILLREHTMKSQKTENYLSPSKYESIDLLHAYIKRGDTFSISLEIRKNGLGWIKEGYSDRLYQWIEALPRLRIFQDPWLTFFFAHATQHSDASSAINAYSDALSAFRKKGEIEGELAATTELIFTLYLNGEDLSATDPLIERAEMLINDTTNAALHYEEQFQACKSIQQFIRHGRMSLNHDAETSMPIQAACETVLKKVLYLSSDSPIQTSLEQLRHHSALLNGQLLIDKEIVRFTAPQSKNIFKPSEQMKISAVEQLLATGNFEKAKEILCSLSIHKNRSSLQQALLLKSKGWLAMYEARQHHPVELLSHACLLLRNIRADGFLKSTELLLAIAQIRQGQFEKGNKLLNQLSEWGKQYGLDAFVSHCSIAQTWLLSETGDEKFTIHLKQTMRMISEAPEILDILFIPAIAQKLLHLSIKDNIDPETAISIIKQKQISPPTSCSVREDEWPWFITVRSFGAFRICVEGVEIHEFEWKGKVMLSLFKAIVAMGGRNVPFTKITDCLWPGTEGDKAAQNLEFNIRRLRNFLATRITPDSKAREWLIVNAGHVSLNPEMCWTDIESFEALRYQAQEKRQNKMAEQAFSDETSAASLIHAPFMPNDIYGYFHHERQQVHKRYSRWIMETAHHWMQDGKEHEALRLLEKGQELDPLSERLCATLAEKLAHAGWTVNAIQVWQDWEQAVRHELGVRPSIKMKKLYENLLHLHEKPTTTS